MSDKDEHMELIPDLREIDNGTVELIDKVNQCLILLNGKHGEPRDFAEPDSLDNASDLVEEIGLNMSDALIAMDNILDSLGKDADM